MTSSTVRMHQRKETFAQRIDGKITSMPSLLSSRAVPTNQARSNSFVAVLLKALSAFAG